MKRTLKAATDLADEIANSSEWRFNSRYELRDLGIRFTIVCKPLHHKELETIFESMNFSYDLTSPFESSEFHEKLKSAARLVLDWIENSGSSIDGGLRDVSSSSTANCGAAPVGGDHESGEELKAEKQKLRGQPEEALKQSNKLGLKTLQRLILALAVHHYDYRRNVLRQRAIVDIAKLTLGTELEVSDDTIRKCLREAMDDLQIDETDLEPLRRNR